MSNLTVVYWRFVPKKKDRIKESKKKLVKIEIKSRKKRKQNLIGWFVDERGRGQGWIMAVELYLIVHWLSLKILNMSDIVDILDSTSTNGNFHF
jgi:hypothetical protein